MATIDVKDAAGATVAVEKPLAPGAAAAAASQPVTASTEDVARIGIITETAPATDTASSGLNGRLQRVAQRLTSMIALLPAVLGAGGGLKVDGSGTALPVSLAALPALVAGSAAIGKLAANSGVDIGDVDVTSLPALPAGTNNIGDVDVLTLPALAAGTNNIGDVDVLTLPAIPAGTNMIGQVTPEGTEYETVAASQTAQALGATGATGDYIAGVLVIPTTVSPGVVTLLDNATSIPVFAGGASSLSNLVPFFIPLGIKSVSGAWKLTTGAGLSCIGIGNFT